MNFQKVFVPLTGLLLLGLSYRSFGWSGVAVACTGIVMFLLLHFTRTMQVLKRAADRPIGYVASAVMLNAKLKPGVTLLHVVAMTRSLGLLKTPRSNSPRPTAGPMAACRMSRASSSTASCRAGR